ncbi:MAG: radical SAM protein [Candidatus Bathyarchaeia archaeon]
MTSDYLAKQLKMIANFAVTYKCNSKCRTCDIWRMSEPDRGEMKLHEIRELFTSNSNALGGLASIQLTGGEPFLRSDLVDIVDIIHNVSPDCFIWIPTNGLKPSLVSETIRRIFERNKEISIGISLSLDGTGQIHDKQRGVAGSYKLALDTLNNLSKLRCRFQDLRISIGMTLTPLNHHQISEVYGISKSFKTDFSVRPVNFSDIYYRNKEMFELKDYVSSISSVFRDIVKDRICEIGYIKTTPFIYYLQGVLDYIRDPSSRILPCHAASESIFIDPYGDVYPCIMMDYRLGNVRRHNLDYILRSARAYKARKLISNLNCPKCWVECEVYRQIYKEKIGLLKTLIHALGRKADMGLH